VIACDCMICLLRVRGEWPAAEPGEMTAEDWERELAADTTDCGGASIYGGPCGGCGRCLRMQHDYYKSLCGTSPPPEATSGRAIGLDAERCRQAKRLTSIGARH
jgi:hypothetical protein